MRLHVKVKELVISGVLMALNVIMLVLSGVLEWNTLFILALASFMTGIIENCFRIRTAVLFLAGSFFLGLILAPKKFYCITFLCFGIYVVVCEYFRKKKVNGEVVKKPVEWGIKIALYHGLLVVLFLFMYLLFGFETISSWSLIEQLKDRAWLLYGILFIVFEVAFVLFDRAYVVFQNRYGTFFTKVIKQTH